MSYPPPGGGIAVITHPRPDLDALASAYGLGFILDAKVRISFSASPAASDHAPAERRFVVDVGGGPFDHHYPRPGGGSYADRSTCAFLKVCNWGASHPHADVRRRAQTLLQNIAPAILRQDALGRPTVEEDRVASVLGLAHFVDILNAQHTDHVVASVVEQWLVMLFVSACERAEAERRAWEALAEVTREVAPDVVQIEATIHNGDLSSLFDVVWESRPGAILTIYELTHTDADDRLVTISRGIGRRRGSAVDVRLVMQHLAHEALPPEVHAELATWHVEDWFAGRGGRKRPVPDAPPAGWMDVIAAHLSEILKNAGKP